ncbi:MULTISPECIES: MarR family winged helix-turn-helix transcriptional regulator [Hyphomicrobium]|uniref:Transcriptional regulator, MarR family n=1 Tax=Hyphomicrobium sulfonivorans TaxID=121290 RepID=A0A120CXU4_HYPSL|nr:MULTISPECIES: MarR family winged helix-turn-helix transcriptional regulator [Hyphomicrobium]KWT71520.1 Transcriptional regulator, MarR family [Hyphomicrobium sulfonivorans]MDH4981642.1 MarR family winged helix-turn-helix transcriptional regulator [Hyphomicrobium sp. D-2]
MTTNSGADMNVMTNTLERKPVETASIADIAETTANACLATRVRQLSRIVTRVYDDAMRPLGITASQYTLLAQLAARDAITAVEIGHELDIEKSTLSRNLKRLLALGHINMDPPAGRRGRGLHLTPKGQAVLKEAFPIWQDAQKRAYSVMGAESRNVLDNLLDQAEKLAPV